MRFNSILSVVLFVISIEEIVLIRINGRTDVLEEIYCEDVCTDGSKCLTDEWFICKWKQMLNPKIICCVNRKTDESNSDHPRSSSFHNQNKCPNTQRHRLVRRSFLSILKEFFTRANRTGAERQRLEEHWPWMASILVFGRHLCGASIISENAVLTAAHCFVPFFDSSVYRIRIGFNGETPQHLTISRVIRHELYFQTESYHDIALVISQSPIRMNSEVSMICLPPPNIRMEQLFGRSGSVIGFTQNNRQVSENLRLITIKVIPKKVCSQMYSIGDKHNIPVGIQEGMVCGTALGSRDTTLGDSGGPLMMNFNGVYYLIGIVSFGRKSSPLNHPSVYTNVVYYRQWIVSKLDSY